MASKPRHRIPEVVQNVLTELPGGRPGVRVRGRPGGRVLAPEVVTIGTLATAGRSVEEIAESLGRAPDTIRRHLLEARQLQKDVLTLIGPEAIQAWRTAQQVAAAKGDHRPAKELLEASGVVEVAKADGPRIAVQVGFAIPGIPQTPQLTP